MSPGPPAMCLDGRAKQSQFSLPAPPAPNRQFPGILPVLKAQECHYISGYEDWGRQTSRSSFARSGR